MFVNIFSSAAQDSCVADAYFCSVESEKCGIINKEDNGKSTSIKEPDLVCRAYRMGNRRIGIC